MVATLYAKPNADMAEARQRSARASRLLRLLRAHKMIRKLPKSHHYQVTEHGREVVALVLAASSRIDANACRAWNRNHLTERRIRGLIDNVLEAKLLGPAGVVVSVASEFIENADAARRQARGPSRSSKTAS